jgi:hypothetical protein
MTKILPVRLAALLTLVSVPILAQTPAKTTRVTPRPAQDAKPVVVDRVVEMDRSGPQGFSVVLVLGDMQGTTAADNVPAAARKALADMKDFLPYKSYRLLDTQWSLCCGRTPLQTTLRGADGEEYELELGASLLHRGEGQPTSVSVRFQLTEMGTLTHAAASNVTESRAAAEISQELMRTQNQLQAAREAAQKRYAVGTGVAPDRDETVMTLDRRVSELRIKLAETRDRGARAGTTRKALQRQVIDTSFRMDVGETVVVGTSRIKGGEKALIALLTAVPPRAPQGSR